MYRLYLLVLFFDSLYKSQYIIPNTTRSSATAEIARVDSYLLHR